MQHALYHPANIGKRIFLQKKGSCCCITCSSPHEMRLYKTYLSHPIGKSIPEQTLHISTPGLPCTCTAILHGWQHDCSSAHCTALMDQAVDDLVQSSAQYCWCRMICCIARGALSGCASGASCWLLRGCCPFLPDDANISSRTCLATHSGVTVRRPGSHIWFCSHFIVSQQRKARASPQRCCHQLQGMSHPSPSCCYSRARLHHWVHRSMAGLLVQSSPAHENTPVP